jgi:hypothetical protein
MRRDRRERAFAHDGRVHLAHDGRVHLKAAQLFFKSSLRLQPRVQFVPA